jgi:tetratricopeptide (TPR) repeat protein
MKSKLYSNPQLILSLANNLYFFQNYDLARKFYERAEKLSPEAFDPTDLAVYCNLLTSARNYDRALGICLRQEQSAPPCEENTVNTRQTIAAIYKEKGQWPKVSQYARKILECQPNHNAARSYLELAKQKDS